MALIPLVALGLAAARPAHAETVLFSFTTDSSSTGGAGQVISGTLSGLTEGDNDGSSVIADVTQSPDASLEGTYTFYDGGAGDAFTVSGGNVTYADALFLQPNVNNALYFGTDPSRIPGQGTFVPELFGEHDGNDYQNQTLPDTFTPAASPAPEPSQLGTLALGALGLGGLLVRARRKASAAA